jgi:hypothetical protein
MNMADRSHWTGTLKATKLQSTGTAKEYGMQDDLMTGTQQSDAHWTLPPGRALRLRAAAVSRVVTVASGRLWLTRDERSDAAAPDVWLEAGQSAALAPHEDAVLEAWPLARFAVLEAPAPAARRFSVARAASWARQLRRRLQWAPVQAACGA